MAKNTHLIKAVGSRYKEFEITRSIEITELQCQLYELVHLPTGAKVMQLANEDPENLFCLSFQTLPKTSNGVAHILEHTVLCGSKKFPVKDPFFAMTRRSLNTFMNALTGSDFTCYPAATQVHKDYYNLLEVYIDAVFNPNLNYFSFLQEGHRVEFTIPEDPHSPLEFKGIVFNEMKGAMASATARLAEMLHAALFPDLTYGINSGGSPDIIPTLTYEELKNFHKEFYHPSRCLFFFYGNMPLEEHLDFIAKHALANVEKKPPIPPIPFQKRFSAPKEFVTNYPIATDESPKGKTIISFAWLTAHILEQEELLALSLLEVILLDTDASLLKRVLLKSGLCKQVSSNFDTDLSEAPFIITLRGCDPENSAPLKELMKSVLTQIAERPIPLQLVENALHQLEFHRSEITNDQGPYGLSLFMRSALLRQHGVNPEEGLKIHSLAKALRQHNLANPRYFNDLLRKHLIDNPHAVTITMIPDDQLTLKESAQEKETLQKIRNQLSREDEKAIINQAERLSVFQSEQEEENEEILPTLTHEDVPKISREFPLSWEKCGSLEIFHHPVFTNGILYTDLVCDLPKIEEEDLPYVRLLTSYISQLGCGDRNYVETLDYMQAHTGGVHASLTLNLQASDPQLFSPSIHIHGKALHGKAKELLTLMQEMATSVDYHDLHRLREVTMKYYTNLHSSLQHSYMRYAISLSSSGLDQPSNIANIWYGIDYYYAIKRIADDIDQLLPWLANKLSTLHAQIFSTENPHLVISCEANFYENLKDHHFYDLEKIPKIVDRLAWDSSNYTLPTVEPQGRATSAPIAFIAKVIKTIPYTHPDAPALNLAAFLCDNLVLHSKIREQGGAYGGGAVCNSMTSNFYFYSYRDPNIHSTLMAFEEAIQMLVLGEFEESDLEEAKLEMIQSLDSPIAPGLRADVAYGWLREGKPHAVRQKFRTSILSLTKEEVIEAAKRQLLPKQDQGIPIIFSSREMLEKENGILKEYHKPPLKILKI